MLRTPVLVLRDKELIKRVTVKDFDHFVNRMKFVDEDSDPLLGRSLISIKGSSFNPYKILLEFSSKY